MKENRKSGTLFPFVEMVKNMEAHTSQDFQCIWITKHNL